MAVLDWVRANLASFLGGGIVVAVVHWINTLRTARRDREISWLQEQLRSLYGPLSFFTNQNEQLLGLAGKVQDAHGAFFAGKWSEDETTQKALEEQSTATTNLGNLYVKRVLENNAHVMELLEKNWHLADPADRDEFSRFQVDHTRFLNEVHQEGRNSIPLQITQQLGPISFMHPDMISCVRSALQSKQMRLAKFRSSWWR